nr:dihydrofolate synthetase [Quercus suber]
MIELGLQRISRLLSETALPWRAIHVAGTNGKGSICAYVTKSIQEYNQSPYRVAKRLPKFKLAQFTSPHLVDRWDCINIDQAPVSRDLFRSVEEAVITRNAEKNIKASEFELLTATAFEIFSRQNVDVGVVEVGMGGRLDATNILGQPVEPDLLQSNGTAASRPLPLVTAIAKIGMDHEAFLGNTLEKIAFEKAGIMKPGVPVVIDDSNAAEVLQVLQEKAGNRIVDYPATAGGLIPTHLPRHMRDNLRVAQLTTLSALSRLGCLPPFDATDWTSVELKDLRKTMLEACMKHQISGRQEYIEMMELTERKTTILCDGAHNAQSAAVLSDSLQKIRNSTKQHVTWVLATSNSKDCHQVLRPLLQPGDAVHAVAFGPVDGMPWVAATEPEQIVHAARELVPELSEAVSHGSDIRGALIGAAEASREGPMVIAGSLYLVGDVHRLLNTK